MSEKVYVFDDGSIESQYLQYELKDKDVQLIKVNPQDSILEWFTKVGEEGKVYIHFTYEEFAKDNEKLRKEIQKAEAVGFKNRIVLPYEGMDNKTLKYRAKEAGIKEGNISYPNHNGVVEDEGKPYRSVNTRKQ